MLSLALALPLVGQDPRPPVAVETYGDADAVRGALIQRFLEDGRVLVSPSAPNVSRVSVRALRHSTLIEISRGGEVLLIEVDRTEEDLLRLEVVHRAVEAVRRIERSTANDERDPLPRAAMHFVGFEPTPAHYAQASEPILQAGFDIVARDAPTDWIVCVWQLEGGFVAQRRDAPPCAVDPPATVTLPAEHPEDPPRGASMLETVQVQADAQAAADREALVDALYEAATDAPTPSHKRARRPAAVQPPPVTPKDTRPPLWLIARADGGVQLRAPAIDGTVGLGIGGGRGRWGGAARAELVPFVFRSPELQILETIVSAGPSVGGSVSERLAWRVYALGGVLVHRSRFEADRAQHRVDAQASIPLQAEIRLRRGLGVHVTASAGISSRSRSHRTADALLWHRSALRFGLSVGLHWRFARREQRP